MVRPLKKHFFCGFPKWEGVVGWWSSKLKEKSAYSYHEYYKEIRDNSDFFFANSGFLFVNYRMKSLTANFSYNYIYNTSKKFGISKMIWKYLGHFVNRFCETSGSRSILKYIVGNMMGSLVSCMFWFFIDFLKIFPKLFLSNCFRMYWSFKKFVALQTPTPYRLKPKTQTFFGICSAANRMWKAFVKKTLFLSQSRSFSWACSAADSFQNIDFFIIWKTIVKKSFF